VDNIRFHSIKEARRYSELLLAVQAGEIRDLQLQVKYSLDVNGVHICNYYADFVYHDYRTETTVVEDSKGKRIQPYPIKAKLMKACHGIDILET
jgi:hypothetical protein